MGSASKLASDQGLIELLRGHHKMALRGPVEASKVASLASSVFEYLITEAKNLTSSPLTAQLAQQFVLRHTELPEAIGHSLVGKLITADMFAQEGAAAPADLEAVRAVYRTKFIEVLRRPDVLSSILADLAKAYIADPATESLFQPLFFYKGFQAVTSYRVAHVLWAASDPPSHCAALLIQSRVSEHATGDRTGTAAKRMAECSLRTSHFALAHRQALCSRHPPRCHAW